MRRGGIFDFAAGRLERLTSARASHLFVTFRRGSFFFSPQSRSCTKKSIQGEKKKKNSRILFFFSSAHTPPLLILSLSLSSQRHKDIFILHKARTLMKHRRHKYISMIFFFSFFFPLSNLAPTAAAVTHFSISVCCCEHKLSECMRVKITPSVSVNVTHLKIV